MTRSLSAAALFLACTICAQEEHVRIEFTALPPATIESRLERVTPRMADRRATIESLFREAGCDGEFLSEKPIPHLKDPNIVCVLPGAGASTIVVGGHYDKAERGIGAVDDWSGSAMLPSLYQSLKSKPRHETFVFIAFAGEEQGLHGSSAYVKRLSREEKARIQAMVNLECLGTSPPKVWATRANKRLLTFYAYLAKSIGIKAEASNLDLVGDDDSHSFLGAKIPVITIHSITTATLPVLHTARDNLNAINANDYYAAYRLIVNYLAFIDQVLG